MLYSVTSGVVVGCDLTASGVAGRAAHTGAAPGRASDPGLLVEGVDALAERRIVRRALRFRGGALAAAVAAAAAHADAGGCAGTIQRRNIDFMYTAADAAGGAGD